MDLMSKYVFHLSTGATVVVAVEGAMIRTKDGLQLAVSVEEWAELTDIIVAMRLTALSRAAVGFPR